MISLRALFALVTLPIKLLLALLKYPIFGGVNKRYKNDLANSLKVILCRSLINFPVKDTPIFATTPTGDMINKGIGKTYPNLTKLPHFGEKFDKQSYWLVESKNRKPNDPVLIYLHGGGYFLDVAPQQIETLLSIYHLLEPAKKLRFSILVLNYNLTSKGFPVPHQLAQLVDTYTSLVRGGSENLLLMGDSAGGNLAITFTQYLRSNKPNLPYPRSVILVSPWVKLIPKVYQNTPGHSYYNYSANDVIQYDRFSSAEVYQGTLGDTKLKSLTVSPGNCPYDPKDWEEIETYRKPGYSVFVLAGEHESFRDDILEWSKYALDYPIPPNLGNSDGVYNPKIHKYIRNNKDSAHVDVNIEPLGVHDVCFFENLLLSKLENDANLTIDGVDAKQFFAIVNIVKFLDTVLPGK